MIAIAMACNPEVLIADEPTTALDVTIQAQILDLMRDLQKEQGTAIMLITHDLGVVAESCQRVVVMYAGQVVEEAEVRTLFKHPRHPYTKGLLASCRSSPVSEKAGPYSGQCAQPGGNARRLPLCSALQLPNGSVCSNRAGLDSVRTRS